MLKWAVKLLVPDFLIGHPNLWDNFKTLRKHPEFRPLRMTLVAWLIFSLATSSLWIFTTKFAGAVAACQNAGVCSGQATVRTMLDLNNVLAHQARAEAVSAPDPTAAFSNKTFELKAGESITIKSAFNAVNAATTPNAGDLIMTVKFLEDNSATVIRSVETLNLPGGFAKQTTNGTDVTFFATSNGLVGGIAKAGTYRIRIHMDYAQTTNDAVNGKYTADSDGNYARQGTPNTWSAMLNSRAKGYVRAGIDLTAISVSQTLGGPTPSPFAWPDSVRVRITSSAQTLTDDATKGITYKTLNGATPVRTMTSMVSKSATTAWDDDGIGMALDTTDPITFGVRIGDLETSVLSERPWTHFESKPVGWSLDADDGGALTTKSVFVSNGSFSYNSVVTLSNLVNTDSNTSRVYNRGETAHGSIDIKNARSEAFTPRGTETLTSIDTGLGIENSITFTKAGFTFTWSSVFASSGNVAPNTAAGSAKKIRWRDGPYYE